MSSSALESEKGSVYSGFSLFILPTCKKLISSDQIKTKDKLFKSFKLTFSKKKKSFLN